MGEHDDDEALLAELEVDIEPIKSATRTPREERIIAGFEDIQRFVDEHGRAPRHSGDADIFERIYAVRLDRLRELPECLELLSELDRQGLLQGPPDAAEGEPSPDLDDEALLAELGIDEDAEDDLTQLKHVKPKAEITPADEVAQRTPCRDFERFESLFEAVRRDLKANTRRAARFQKDASVDVGEFFILGGQLAFVAALGEPFETKEGRANRRLHVVFDNGTESRPLLRSFQRALYKDEQGRRVSDPDAGPLFGGNPGEGDEQSGTVYVLRSKSDHPDVLANRKFIHKIGVTGGSVEKRVANAKLDPTFLFADVEVVAKYELYNINRHKLEHLLHRIFEASRLVVEIPDRFGNPVKAREWFFVPLNVIDEAIEKIRDGTISGCRYDPKTASLQSEP